MQKAKVLLWIGAFVMAAAIVYGFVAGGYFPGFLEALVTLPKYPWFNVTIIDLYIGFFLFAGWIAYRENSVGRSLLFLLLMCTLGNVFACVYAVIALMQSGGDMKKFWMGNRATLN